MALEVWGGVECSVVRIGDSYRDSMRRSGHDRRSDDVARIAALGVQAVRFPLLWELTAPGSVADADWRWGDERLEALRALGVRAVVGLVHHGSGPRTTDLLDGSFAERLAEYASAVARRYPFVEEFTPINEPLTTARFSALYGHWYPHARSASSFARALVNQCRATVVAMDAIRAVNPRARLVQTEDFGTIQSTPAMAYQAEHENHRRWSSLDLLCGRVGPRHPLYGFLCGAGIAEDELAFFSTHPRPPDIIGLNYYLTSERYLDERLSRYPPALHGGNGRDRYADVESIRVGAPLEGHLGALVATWTRYGLPVAITEVHLGCTREEQLRWWAEAWRSARAALFRGVDVRAVCAWALFGSHDWDSLLVAERGEYEPGAFDVRSEPPRPTAIARAVAQTAARGECTHPVLDGEGWWRRPGHVLYGPASPSPHSGPGSIGAPSRGRPILITGAAGALGRALARICETRGLACRGLPREQLDVTDASSVARALEVHRPWAVVNAAGFVRVDAAEAERVACWRTNVEGSRALAAACATRGVRFATLSSDLVFDGRLARRYVETDAPAPLNLYGASKAESERVVLAACPDALIVRTSALFGPWDTSNFVSRAVRAFTEREPFRAAEDLVVSPTYVPDLVAWILDLTIDHEHGVWHVANDGAVSWCELARLAARAHGVSAATLVPCEGRSAGSGAHRPRFSALSSARGAALRPLEAALRIWSQARAA